MRDNNIFNNCLEGSILVELGNMSQKNFIICELNDSTKPQNTTIYYLLIHTLKYVIVKQ